MSIYSWGRNSNGELGLADFSKDEWEPKAMPLSHLATSIAAGDGHSLYTTEAGDVYACGRGRQGQLGLQSRENHPSATLVTELSHESVVRVAASGVSSYAITATGRLYHWGLVHRPEHLSAGHEETKGGEGNKEASADLLSRQYDQVAAGQLTGLAENQEEIIVHVDTEARAHMTQRGGDEPRYVSRRLKDIVTDSTDRWLLANDDADAEYYRELQSMGYDKEELDERMQNRGREYHGMLRVQCKRVIVPVPELISSLLHVKVVALAAGFAHCIALSDQGAMYACGYNDRGQLGLGHRISSSEFKVVDYMQGKRVLQVECGQQHSMCRAIDRGFHRERDRAACPEAAQAQAEIDSGAVGASVYVWGNGMLGQLGLGLKGTSKGRLLPTLLTTLCDMAPLGAVDISAGGNFSVAVGLDGAVYSWGHAEYNQHGSTMVGGSDYVDHHYFFVPRLMAVTSSDGAPERIAQVSCGSNFTVAVTDRGDVYSWGWNAYGVLGHGKGYFGQSALKIASLGRSQIDRSVARVCTGSNHVMALTTSSGNAWARTFQSLLLPSEVVCAPASTPVPSRYDPDTFSDAEVVDETTGSVFPCHRVVLAARSAYFAGYFRIAAKARSAEGETDHEEQKEARGAAVKKEQQQQQQRVKVQVFLDACPAASASSIQYLLQYVYTDTLSAPAHKRKQLAELADFVGLHRLAMLCRHHGNYADRSRDPDSAPSVPPSSFEQDMLAMVNSELFCDCKFLVHPLPPPESEDICNDAFQKDPILVPGHKLLYSKMPYFSSLFSGDFSDGVLDSDGGAMVYDLGGFVSDGIGPDSFERLVKYAYSGALSVLDVEDSGDLMGLLVASNRVNLFRLTQLCEKKLSLHLTDYPENIENCYAFAQMYNVPRLSRQCEELRGMLQLATGGGSSSRSSSSRKR